MRRQEWVILFFQTDCRVKQVIQLVVLPKLSLSKPQFGWRGHLQISAFEFEFEFKVKIHWWLSCPSAVSAKCYSDRTNSRTSSHFLMDNFQESRYQYVMKITLIFFQH